MITWYSSGNRISKAATWSKKAESRKSELTLNLEESLFAEAKASRLKYITEAVECFEIIELSSRSVVLQRKGLTNAQDEG